MNVSRLCHQLSAIVAKRLRAIAGSGLSPGRLALTICIGGAIGILPLPWGTTLLCVALACFLGLNQIVLQSLNYLFYPLQLALLIPYCRLGSRLFPGGTAFPLETVASLLHTPLPTTFDRYGWVILKAQAAWLVTAPPAALMLYPLLVWLIRRRRTEHLNT